MTSLSKNLKSDGSPRITAVVFAYNNSATILRALGSIDRQTIRNQVSVLVHDDCSIDGTARLAEQFLVNSGLAGRVVVPEENQYQYGIEFFLRVLLTIDTEFIALCDADDYWLSENKLASQVEMLDADPTLALVHHSFLPALGNDPPSTLSLPARRFRTVLDGDSLLSGNFIGACTVLFRTSSVKSVKDWSGYESLKVPDYPLWGAIASGNRVGFVENIESVYSITKNGMSDGMRFRGIEAASQRVQKWLAGRVSMSTGTNSGNFPRSTARIMRSFLLLANPKVSTVWWLRLALKKISRNADPSLR